MRNTSLILISLLLTACLLTLNGCGRKGDLYEPTYDKPGKLA